MAKNFEWNYAEAGELLLRSAEIAEFCEQQAERMTRATGMEYVPDVKVGAQRVNAAGYDHVKSAEGQYRKRKNGRTVYTQNKIKEVGNS